MSRREKVPSMEEVRARGEAETIRRARKVFRSSLVVGLEPVLGYESLSKLEGWFINKALDSYRQKVNSETYLDMELTILNASAWLVGLELYEKMLLGFYDRMENWQVRRATETLDKLESEIRIAEEVVRTYPQKLEELKQKNEEVTELVNQLIRPISSGLSESLGGMGGFGIMILGIVSGGVGFVVGKMSRAVFDMIREKIASILESLGRK